MKTIQTTALACILLCAVSFAQNTGLKVSSRNTFPANVSGAQTGKTIVTGAVITNADLHYSTITKVANHTAETALAVNPDKEAAQCTVPATPGTINGSPVGCYGIPTTYSVAAVPGATSYVWRVSGGVIIGSKTGPSVLVKWSYNGQSISVRASNSCGLSGTRTKTLTRVINCSNPE